MGSKKLWDRFVGNMEVTTGKVQRVPKQPTMVRREVTKKLKDAVAKKRGRPKKK